MRLQPSSSLEERIRLALGLSALFLIVVLLLRLLLPWLLVIGLGGLAFMGWQRWQRYQNSRQAALNASFYVLLQTQGGRMSVLDFAMQAQINGLQAKQYLDDQARAFSASFEPTEQGDLIYIFPVGQSMVRPR